MSDRDDRLDHERYALERDYESRRASMLKLAIIMGVVVVFSLLSLFIGIIAINLAIDQLKINEKTLHNCTVALLKEHLQGETDLNPPACTEENRL